MCFSLKIKRNVKTIRDDVVPHDLVMVACAV